MYRPEGFVMVFGLRVGIAVCMRFSVTWHCCDCCHLHAFHACLGLAFHLGIPSRSVLQTLSVVNQHAYQKY